MARTPATTAAWSPRLDGHLPVLDDLRGIAILLVLFYHMTSADKPGGTIEHVLKVVFRNFGWCGVDLFFVL